MPQRYNKYKTKAILLFSIIICRTQPVEKNRYPLNTTYTQLCNIPYQNQPDLLRKIKYKTAKLFFFPQSFDKENIPISL